MTLTLTQLEYIVAVERAGSFYKAAKACHVTQPTLSMQVKKLEDDLGIIIFDRATQPILPTTIGQKVISQARIVLAQAEVLLGVVVDERKSIAGTLRIAVIPTIAPYLLPLFLPEFHKRFNEVELVVQELTTAEIIRALQTNQLDVGILATPLHEPELVEYPLYMEELYVYAPASDEAVISGQVTQGDLAEDSLLLLTEGHCLRDQMLALCRRSRKKLAKLGTMQFESGSLGTLCRLVEQGYGYTILPALAKENEARKLGRVVKFADPCPAREISLVVHKSFVREKLKDAIASTVDQVLPPDVIARNGKIIPVR